MEVVDRIPKVNKDNKFLVYEPYTDQYFYTTKETLMWVMLELNQKLQREYCVYLDPIVKMLGGKSTPDGQKLRWSIDDETQMDTWGYTGGIWIDIWPNVYESGGKEALALFYSVEPCEEVFENTMYKEET